MPDTIIKVEDLSKVFEMYKHPSERFKEMLGFGKKSNISTISVLSNISFELKKGETLGIIGKNGSGKSTLLKILSGLLAPTSGKVELKGKVNALLDIGSGFDPNMTGMENIYFFGMINGLNKQNIQDKIDSILDFAEIGESINYPIKTYSSGMFLRLAFAVQTAFEPEILIVDEILAVGDIFFQQKCHEKIETMVKKGLSLIIVSHDISIIEKYSKYALLLNKGENLFLGDPKECILRYFNMNNPEVIIQVSTENANDTVSNESKSSSRNGNLESQFFWPPKEAFIKNDNTKIISNTNNAKFLGLAMCDENGNTTNRFFIHQTAYFYYEFELLEDIAIPIGGIAIINSLGITLHAKDTNQYSYNNNIPDFIKSGTKLRFLQTIKLDISIGEYTLTLGLGTMDCNDYKKIKNISYNMRDLFLKPILRVHQAGKFVVVENFNSDNVYPFHGYFDLKGDYKFMEYTNEC